MFEFVCGPGRVGVYHAWCTAECIFDFCDTTFKGIDSGKSCIPTLLCTGVCPGLKTASHDGSVAWLSRMQTPGAARTAVGTPCGSSTDPGGGAQRSAREVLQQLGLHLAGLQNVLSIIARSEEHQSPGEVTASRVVTVARLHSPLWGVPDVGWRAEHVERVPLSLASWARVARMQNVVGISSVRGVLNAFGTGQLFAQAGLFDALQVYDHSLRTADVLLKECVRLVESIVSNISQFLGTNVDGKHAGRTSHRDRGVFSSQELARRRALCNPILNFTLALLSEVHLQTDRAVR